MKKIVALLLVFVMVFSLCGCDSKELSAEEKEQIYKEVAAEKASAAAATADEQNSAEMMEGQETVADGQKYAGLDKAQMDGNAITYMAPFPTEEDYVLVEKMKLKQTSDGKYVPDALIKNLYTERVPDTINLYCHYINSDGEVVDRVTISLGRVPSNQSTWVSAVTSKAFTPIDLSEISEIQFVNYEMLCILSVQDVWYQNFAFNSPVSFKTADIEIQ